MNLIICGQSYLSYLWSGGGATCPTYDLRVVGEGFGFARLVVRLPLQLDEHGRRLLQVLVSILRGLEHDGELWAENTSPWKHGNKRTHHYNTNKTITAEGLQPLRSTETFWPKKGATIIKFSLFLSLICRPPWEEPPSLWSLHFFTV